MAISKICIAAFVLGSRGLSFVSTSGSRRIGTHSLSMSQSNSTAGGRTAGRGRGGQNRKPQSNSAPPRTGVASGGRGTHGGRTKNNGGRGAGARPVPNAMTRINNFQTKANGERGAEIHTVSESDRIRLTRALMSLRESDQTSTTFSPQLTNTERKFVHSLSMQLGLVSKSYGKGENRCITVSKPAGKLKKTGHHDEEEDIVPSLHIGDHGTAALKKHMRAFPPTETERKESYETGSALLGDANDTAVNATLAGMGLASKPTVKKVSVKKVHVDLTRRAQLHAEAQQRKRAHASFHRMQQQRQKLPAWSYQHDICSTVSNNGVTVISGETGCGKSTQVPQFLLDNDPTASIVVTQPRRISAISVAERVASEQCLEPIGGIVGYQVRLESAMSSSTQLLFLTPGVLLRKLQSSPKLAEFTYIIIDEIHCRDKYTEFLLIALRDLLPSRPDLRIVLMSATLQTETLLEYWYSAGNSGAGATPGQISIPGRTFPVQEFFLEDILTMTKFLEEKDVDTMDQLEAAMAMLLAKKNLDQPIVKKRKMTKQKLLTDVDSEVPPPLLTGESSFVCAMCHKAGFSTPEDLGTHIAFCDGGAGESMAALEDRVRNTHVGNMTCAATINFNGEKGDEIIFEDYEIADEQSNIDDDSSVDSNIERWDGESAFEASSPSTEPITTEDEAKLLDQYQAIHDDEKVDDALVMEVVQLIVASSYGDGAILIFFPGWAEISEFSMQLDSTPPFHNRNKYIILPLHSGIPSKDQRKVFEKPPKGVRKIILSTNIAETSVTIDDVSFVIDTGRAKEKSYDPHLKTSTLAPTWISQASANQRKGRAGRTKRGVAFRLFSRRRHASFRPFDDSELLRTPLVSEVVVFLFQFV